MLLRRFLRDRRGASEIVGTAMFLVILVFFFSNVFLWHNQATREMDQVVADRMNSGIRVKIANETAIPIVLIVDNVGGLDVTLSRLWIVNRTQTIGSGNDHLFADFELTDVRVAAGDQSNITLSGETVSGEMEGSVRVRVSVGGSVIVDYAPPPETRVLFRVLTKRANSAACSLEP